MFTAWAEEMAAKLNAHLAGDGVVQVYTYSKATDYGRRHAGCFTADGDSLYVRRRRGRERLSIGDRLQVGIRTGFRRAT